MKKTKTQLSVSFKRDFPKIAKINSPQERPVSSNREKLVHAKHKNRQSAKFRYSRESSDFFSEIEKMDTIIKRENCLEDSKLAKQAIMCSCVCWPRGTKWNLNHVQEIQITFISNTILRTLYQQRSCYCLITTRMSGIYLFTSF